MRVRPRVFFFTAMDLDLKGPHRRLAADLRRSRRWIKNFPPRGEGLEEALKPPGRGARPRRDHRARLHSGPLGPLPAAWIPRAPGRACRRQLAAGLTERVRRQHRRARGDRGPAGLDTPFRPGPPESVNWAPAEGPARGHGPPPLAADSAVPHRQGKKRALLGRACSTATPALLTAAEARPADATRPLAGRGQRRFEAAAWAFRRDAMTRETWTRAAFTEPWRSTTTCVAKGRNRWPAAEAGVPASTASGGGPARQTRRGGAGRAGKELLRTEIKGSAAVVDAWRAHVSNRFVFFLMIAARLSEVRRTGRGEKPHVLPQSSRKGSTSTVAIEHFARASDPRVIPRGDHGAGNEKPSGGRVWLPAGRGLGGDVSRPGGYWTHSPQRLTPRRAADP